MAKKQIKKEELLEKAKSMTIQQLADEYGVCYQTMQKYLKGIGFEGTIGRPSSLKIC